MPQEYEKNLLCHAVLAAHALFQQLYSGNSQDVKHRRHCITKIDLREFIFNGFSFGEFAFINDLFDFSISCFPFFKSVPS